MNWVEPYGERPNETPPPIKWRDMTEAPKDGQWVLLDIDDGTKGLASYEYSNVYVGRWNPKTFPEIGTHFYEWELIDRCPDQQFGGGTITTHYSEGRVCGWLPFPT